MNDTYRQNRTVKSPDGEGSSRSRWGRYLLLVIFLTVTACSSTTFIYNRLHIFIPWYIDDYVELNTPQDKKLDALLKTWLHQHRSEYLPRYSALLKRMLVALDEPLTLEQANVLYADVASEFEHLQADFLGWMLALGEDLDEEQLLDFMSNLQRQQREYREKYLQRDLQAVQQASYESLKDSLEGYLGRLQRAQLDQLKTASGELARLDIHWLAQRQYRLDQLAPLLRRESGWQEQIHVLMMEDVPTSEAYQHVYQANLAVILRTIVSIINERTEKQDRRLRARLKNLYDDFEQLNQRADESSH